MLKSILSSLLLILSVTSLQSQTLNKKALISQDFEKHHLNNSNIPEKWEDGIRTSGGKGTYEWWYFDTHLEDGSTAVIIFYTKHITKIKKALLPLITVSIVQADGTKFDKMVEFNPKEFSASKDSCNVQIGKNYVRGNLKSYDIHFEDDDFNMTITMDRTTESWRPKTGILEFGDDREDYFAWVVPVPKAHVTVNYTYKGNKYEGKGSGYHDHNWGNTSLVNLFNHWYWARAEVGPFSMIASEMIAEKKYNNESIVVLNVAKEGKTIIDNEELVKAYRTYGKMDKQLNKDISDDISFIYHNPDDNLKYEINLHKKNTLTSADILLSTIGKKNLKYKLARLFTGFDGAYYRFTGIAEIKVYSKDQLVESYSSPTAIWELMYFGKP
ncbi:MAG: lipocalin-like domain-containing protein [Crocinitomicaceae bacterium]